ncbi:unnamed protein product [Cuscuta campestris]|uniref:Uncharacterized protein n=1 Tax=Cuscuta campestris TaxID=132261 RepID=A0A484LBS1_9ASTE|nr:unnamed protein product [Cuscuta campestris]
MSSSNFDSSAPSSSPALADQPINPGQARGPPGSPQLSSAAPSDRGRQRLRKQFSSPQPKLLGPRVELEENIMALCHCQISDQGFADATNMAGPAIEVRRPSKTETTLNAPKEFFTVHLASLKRSLRSCCTLWTVVTEECLTKLGIEFVKDDHRHQPNLLRDIPERNDDSSPFVKQEEETETPVLRPGGPLPGRSRGVRWIRSKGTNSHGGIGDNGDQLSPRKRIHGEELSGRHVDHHLVQPTSRVTMGEPSERPPSLVDPPPVVNIDIETKTGSARFCVPHRQCVGLKEFPAETTATLPSADQACLSACSNRDLADMILFKFGQASLGVLELARRATIFSR